MGDLLRGSNGYVVVTGVIGSRVQTKPVAAGDQINWGGGTITVKTVDSTTGVPYPPAVSGSSGGITNPSAPPPQVGQDFTTPAGQYQMATPGKIDDVNEVY